MTLSKLGLTSNTSTPTPTSTTPIQLSTRRFLATETSTTKAKRVSTAKKAITSTKKPATKVVKKAAPKKKTKPAPKLKAWEARGEDGKLREFATRSQEPAYNIVGRL